MRIVFLGSPEFAETVLAGLLKKYVEVALVVTQPPRVPQRRGRGAEPVPPPAARFAAAEGLPVRFPSKLAEIADELMAIKPDTFIVAAFGQIIPAELLTEQPPWVNVHASLLPAYRGASPVSQAILDGRRETGVSLMQVTAGLDEGPVYAMTPEPIKPDDTTGSLSERLAHAGTALLLEKLPAIIAGTAKPTPQSGNTTYAEKLTKESGRIDWQQDTAFLEGLVRAMQPWPVAWTESDGVPLSILRATPTGTATGEPGTFAAEPPLTVATGDGSLTLERVRPAGKQEMSGADWLRGRRRGGRFS